jgi:bifunctional non-homologous end joining protein LigD
MANYGAGELNPWTSRVEAPHEPTGALVDIDPGTETTFAEVRQLARLYYTALDHLGLLGGPKVTGQSGLQLWIPVRRSYSFDDTRVWVERLSRAVGATLPEMVSWAWRKADRQGQARLHPEPVNKTLVAPYSPARRRARRCRCPSPGTNSATGRCGPTAGRRTVGKRLAEVGDPLRDLVGMQQSLPDL